MWVDISAKDPAVARAFYSSLLGWTHDEPREEMGNYAIFSYNGKVVAGVGPTMDPNAPTAWMQYVAAEDANAIAEAVKTHGGEVVAGPMDVADQGSMLVFKDSTGAYCGVWQPNQMHGAELVNKPGAFAWSELNTRDIDGARKFYSSVFNWGIHENDFESQDGPGIYTEWQVDGRTVGGGMPMVSSVPAEVPAHWLIYFAVADCDATSAKCTELGGTVMVPAMDIPQGRMAILTDNQGASFAIITMKS
jgi:predicted enzyme related to lactoylglutathione lyase